MTWNGRAEHGASLAIGSFIEQRFGKLDGCESPQHQKKSTTKSAARRRRERRRLLARRASGGVTSATCGSSLFVVAGSVLPAGRRSRPWAPWATSCSTRSNWSWAWDGFSCRYVHWLRARVALEQDRAGPQPNHWGSRFAWSVSAALVDLAGGRPGLHEGVKRSDSRRWLGALVGGGLYRTIGLGGAIVVLVALLIVALMVVDGHSD